MFQKLLLGLFCETGHLVLGEEHAGIVHLDVVRCGSLEHILLLSLLSIDVIFRGSSAGPDRHLQLLPSHQLLVVAKQQSIITLHPVTIMQCTYMLTSTDPTPLGVPRFTKSLISLDRPMCRVSPPRA